MAGSESFTKYVLGVIKCPLFAFSVSDHCQVSKKPVFQALYKIDCFQIDDRRNHVVNYEWTWMCLMDQQAMTLTQNSLEPCKISVLLWNYKISTLLWRSLLRSCSTVFSFFHSRGMNDCQAVTKPDLFPKQSGHFGQEFDMSDNPNALTQQSPYSGDLSHGHLGLCY